MLVVMLALGTLVALALTVVRFEVNDSALHAEKIRADWAARAALNEAVARLLDAVTVSGSADRMFVTSQLEPPAEFANLSPILTISGNGQIHPLISTEIQPFVVDDDAVPTALFQERDGADLNRDGLIVSATPAPDYTVKLLELKNDDDIVARYGYQVFDEEARLDARLHRAADRDGFGQSAAEIPPAVLTGTEQELLLTFPKLPASPLAFAQAVDSVRRREELKHFFGLRGADGEEVIPRGLPEAGRPKYNINDLAADAELAPEQRAEKIAAIIDRNLPDFKKRDPSLAGESADGQRRYLQRLAASIVEYVDPGANCVTVGGEPAGRGLFPLVVGVAERYLWVGGDSVSAVIETRAFAQVWNPCTMTVSGRARLRLANRQRVTFGAGIVTPLDDYDAVADDEIMVRPNEFKVIAFPAARQTFTSPTASVSGPRWAGSPADSADQTTHEPFEFFWNGARVDMHRRAPVGPGTASAGLVRNAKTLEFNRVHYQVNTIPTFAGVNVVGDPRATYLGNYDWGSTISGDDTYARNTHWGGRGLRGGDYRQDFVATWVARDYIRANPPVGNPPGSVNVSPDQVPLPYDADRDAPNAPFFIRKDRMKSIGELGHIFDPAQANDAGLAPKGGSPASVFVSGGGRTLRVGQPEFAYWDRDGWRALELLDIFTVNPVAADGDYPRMAGRININTAPREVLAALLHNIEIKSDEEANAGGDIGKLDTARLAEVIISERRKAPFEKLSDLRRVLPALNRADAYQPRLGTGAGGDPPLVMDRAREEAFAKFCNLVTVQSCNYRVCAVGQALAADGRVAAVTFLTAIVSVEPEKDADGRTVFKPRVIYVYQQ
ncbi:MAG: general secretion pathway protein GspK [Verrucomicrobiales bacterium]|nr:general secretion pathway protein GspK [Verrucomicrobiales bacterium]